MKASLTRTLQFLLAVVGAGAFAIVNIAPADAATDVAAPLIGSSRVTTTTLDATNSEASLVFSVNLTDETAVSDFVGRIRHPATGQSYFLSNEFLAAGTAQDGTWQATATIPKGSAPGQWVIQLFAITDTLANQTSGFFDLQTVTVTSASADIAAPAIVSNAVTKTTLDATNAADSLIFSVRLTDETAVSDYVARLRHPATGQSYFLSTEYLATGTKQNGVWRATAGVPRGAAPGQWVIELFAITDTLANQTSGFFNVRTITVK